MFGFVKSTIKLTNVRCNPQAPFCAVTASLAPPGRTPEVVLRVAFSTSARIDDAGSDKGAGSASGGGGGGDDLAWLKGKIDRLEGKMDAIETKGDAATDFDTKFYSKYEFQLASRYEQLAAKEQSLAADKATDKEIELIKLQNEVTTGTASTFPHLASPLICALLARDWGLARAAFNGFARKGLDASRVASHSRPSSSPRASVRCHVHEPLVSHFWACTEHEMDREMD